MVEQNASDRGANRRVPGGTRLYLRYVGGVSAPAAGKELEFLSGVSLQKSSGRTVADLAANPALPSQAGLEEILARRISGLDTAEERRRASLEWLEEVRDSVTEFEQRSAIGTENVWLGLEGGIRNSGCWTLIREDGVVEMEGRFTIEARDGTLVSVQLRGTADLSAAYGGVPGTEAYAAWSMGAPPKAPAIPFNASVAFEAPSDPGEKAAFMAKRYASASRHYWKYVRLTRQTFVGSGAVTFGSEVGRDTGFARDIELHFYELLRADG
jgi:hypothetical protein